MHKLCDDFVVSVFVLKSRRRRESRDAERAMIYLSLSHTPDHSEPELLLHASNLLREVSGNKQQRFTSILRLHCACL